MRDGMKTINGKNYMQNNNILYCIMNNIMSYRLYNLFTWF